MCGNEFHNQGRDEHAGSHERRATSEQSPAPEPLSQEPDKERASNDFHGTKQAREEQIAISRTPHQKLEILRPKHSKRTAAGSILENEQHRTDEEAQAISGLPELADGEVVLRRCLGFEPDLHLRELGRGTFARVAADPGDGFPGLVGAAAGQEPARGLGETEHAQEEEPRGDELEADWDLPFSGHFGNLGVVGNALFF